MPKAKEAGFDTPWKGGFHITFENGCTISIQFRAGNYCEHHNNYPEDMATIDGLYIDRSKDAEIAAWNKNGRWVHPDNWDDDVKGWCSPAEVLEFMNWVANLP